MFCDGQFQSTEIGREKKVVKYLKILYSQI